MEAKFNSQICTTREQSERLLALGLKRETADMAYLWYGRAEDDSPMLMDKPSIVYQGIMAKHDIPAWSLHRLMCFVFNNGGTHVDIFEDDDAYEVLIYNIEMRIKEGYFNKEYLG